MVKKEFTAPRAKKYDDMSDVDLIELLDTGVESRAARETINALLEKRTKKAIQDLTEKIQTSSKITEKYNKILVRLTWIIAILTLFMLLGLIAQLINNTDNFNNHIKQEVFNECFNYYSEIEKEQGISQESVNTCSNKAKLYLENLK